MSDYSNTLGRIGELLIDGSSEAMTEIASLVSPHMATEELRGQLMEVPSRAGTARRRSHARQEPDTE